MHIALKNGGGVRETIAGPEITRISIQAALAFDNKLAIVKVTVPQLLAIFENGLSRYPDYDGRFPQVSGMTIVFDPSQPGVESQTSLDSVSRIVDLMVGDDAVVEAGEVVADMDMTFVVATNSFLLTGGDGYAAFIEAESLAETSIGEQQILEEYIVGELGGKVDMDDPPVDPRVAPTSGEPATNDEVVAEEPATNDEVVVEDPATNDEVAEPATDDEVPEPSTNDEVDAPEASASSDKSPAAFRSSVISTTFLITIGMIVLG